MPRLDGLVRDMSPCKGCRKRHTGCHGDCQDYMDWKETVRQVNKARKDYMEQPPVRYSDLKFGKRKEIQ